MTAVRERRRRTHTRHVRVIERTTTDTWEVSVDDREITGAVSSIAVRVGIGIADWGRRRAERRRCPALDKDMARLMSLRRIDEVRYLTGGIN